MKDRYKVKIGDETHEVFMSFGLLNEVCTVIGDVENIALMQTDGTLRTAVLNSVLSQRDEVGEISEHFNIMTSNLTTDEALKLLDWVAEHAFDFFLKSLESAKNLSDKHGPRMQTLLSSLTGLADSVGSEQSASSSESAPAS